MPRRFASIIGRWPASRVRQGLVGLATTVLLLNLASAFIRGGTTIAIFGVTVRTPSFRASLLILAAWAGARLVLRHRRRLRLAPAGAFLRTHVPETIVAVVFVLGLVLRLSGIGFGNPLVLHPDEHQVVGVAVTMLKEGSLAVPVPYHYPTVFHYLLLPAFALLYVRGKSSGLWSSLDDIDIHTFQFYELARAHSAVLGALTILLTFVLASRMWPGRRGRWVGAIAAAYLSFAFNHVKESHNGVTDAALTFFVVLAFIAIVSALHRGSRGAFALAGFAVGIACATKYSAFPLVFVLVAAHLLDPKRLWTDWRRLAIGLAAIPIGFFTGYPYALLNWPPFLEHLGWMSGFSGKRTFDPNARFEMIVKYAAESGFGRLFTLAFAAAAVYALVRRRAEEMVALIFIVVALSLLSNTAFTFYARYLLPLMPFAALLVGSALIDAADSLQARTAVGWRAAVPAAVVVVVCALIWTQARDTFRFVRYVTSTDTRVEMYHYILEHVPKGSTIASEEPYLVLPEDYKVLRWTPLQSRHADEFARHNVAALVFSTARDLNDGSEHDRDRRELRRRFPLQVAFPSGLSDVVGPGLQLHVRPSR